MNVLNFKKEAFPGHFHLPIEAGKHIFAQQTAPGQLNFSLVQTRLFFLIQQTYWNKKCT